MPRRRNHIARPLDSLRGATAAHARLAEGEPAPAGDDAEADGAASEHEADATKTKAQPTSTGGTK